MYKSYKIIMLPNNEQEKLLIETLNIAKWVWNWGLKKYIEFYKNGLNTYKKYYLIKILKKEFSEIRNSPNYSFLKVASYKTGIYTLEKLDNHFRYFVSKQKLLELKGQNKYRKKFIKDCDSIENLLYCPQFIPERQTIKSYNHREDKIYFKNNKVVLEFIGHVKIKKPKGIKIKWGSKYKGKSIYKNPVVVYKNNKWILYITLDIPIKNNLNNKNKIIGIDIGMENYVTLSNGMVFEGFRKNKNIIKLERKKEKVILNLKRKNKENKGNNGSNYNKELKKLEKINNKIYKIKLNTIYHIVKEIIDQKPTTIVLEKLNLLELINKDKHLSKSIKKCLFYKLLSVIKLKAIENGINVIFAHRYYPSTKLCSNCGNKKDRISLKERIYKCSICGLEIDRDLNAAKNLEKYGLEKLL